MWCLVAVALASIGLSRGFYVMCPAIGRCGQHELQPWRVSPRELAKQARKLTTDSVPGVPGGAYGVVAKHWRASPPRFKGRPVSLDDIASFAKAVLYSNPFGTWDNVPFVDFGGPGEGKVVGLTQRGLAFLVANALLGNSIPAGDGLSAALQRCSYKTAPFRAYLYSLLSLLAVLSQELEPGEQGTTLIAMTPRARDDKAWRVRLHTTKLAGTNVCGMGTVRDHSGQPTRCELDDFMMGGPPHQTLTDIAGDVVGGGAQLCDLASSQDESLVQFYSEVLAFAFFASGLIKRVPTPWVLLGARRYMQSIEGESTLGPPYNGMCGYIPALNWLNEDIPLNPVKVSVAGETARLHARAFVAISSSCVACKGKCEAETARWNGCDAQRRVLDDDLGRFYQAYEPSMYNDVVQEAFRTVVRRIGTGPWGAGVWMGDSQQSFLTVWLATSLLNGIDTLDYYVYDRFCENAGNQCYVLGRAGCNTCISQSRSSLPSSHCGNQSIHDVMNHFAGFPAGILYENLSRVDGPPLQVFDLLMGARNPTTTTTTTSMTHGTTAWEGFVTLAAVALALLLLLMAAAFSPIRKLALRLRPPQAELAGLSETSSTRSAKRYMPLEDPASKAVSATADSCEITGCLQCTTGRETSQL